MRKSKLSRRHFIEAATVGLAASYATSALADDHAAAPQKSAGRFQDKIVLVTGATSGIGQICAEAFAKAGAKVFFCGRREKDGSEIAQNWNKLGLDVSFFKADVKIETEVKAFVETCVKKYGRIDIAFNNAGIYPNADFVTTPSDVHLDTRETNINGTFFSMKYEIEQMLKQKPGGTIVNMASTAAHKASRFESASYCASKHAVLGLTKTAAQVYGKHIRVNAISPSLIDLPYQREGKGAQFLKGKTDALISTTPAGRLCKTDDVVQALMWLASAESAYTHGQSIILDGGRLA